MKQYFIPFLKTVVTGLLLLASGLAQGQEITKPRAHFGFQPGADRQLFDYEALIGYMELLDEQSAMLEMRKIGESPMGKPIYIAFISAAENIARLDSLKTINRELARNPELTAQKRARYFQDGRVFIYATLSMHSNEVGPSQAAPLIASEMLTNETLQTHLQDVVLMLVPSHNPDGMNMVVQNYRKYKGTRYEGARYPGVYHKYVGHDNNRDFVTLTQKDNQAIARVYNKTWFPQVMVEKHQMGTTGPRYFVPPPHDPIAMNVDAPTWNWIDIFGSHMMERMERHGLNGVSQQYLFDDYWPGTTETCIWKGVIGMLTEAARVQSATPVYIEPNELKTYGKGLGEYAKSINMTAPWEGGWWRLSDIMHYEMQSMFSMIETASRYKAEILQYRNDQTQKQVALGKTEAPFFYILPQKQHDQSEWVHVVNLLERHGVNTFTLDEEVTLNQRVYKPGDIVVPLAQPFRPFVKEVLENQTFPERHYTPDGKMIRPYDITSWSLPLHKGVTCHEINTYNESLATKRSPVETPFRLAKQAANNHEILALTSNNNESYKLAFKAMQEGTKVFRIAEKSSAGDKAYPAGSFFVRRNELPEGFLKDVRVIPDRINRIPSTAKAVELPETGLVESHFHDMDAGWTRYIFDTYHIPYKVYHPDALKEGELRKEIDLLIFPGERKSILMKGKYKSSGGYHSTTYPPEFTKGMEQEGLNNVIRFLHNGGKILAWGRSVALFEGSLKHKKDDEVKETFRLPFQNISDQLKKQKDLYVPGALLQMELKPEHPLTYGCPEEVGVLYNARGVFETSIPHFDMDRRVIGRFPDEKLLLSGYGEGLQALEQQPAMVWLKKGKGELVFYGFNPQFRASTDGTFKLLFNALLP